MTFEADLQSRRGQAVRRVADGAGQVRAQCGDHSAHGRRPQGDCGTRRAGRRGRRRRQLFSRSAGGRQGDRAGARRFDRDAGDGDERARHGGRARADRPAGPRAVGGRHAVAVPALFAPGGARPSRQASGHHAGGGHRKSVLHHRYRRGAPGLRTFLRRGDEGDPGRRNLHRGPQKRSRARSATTG